MKFSISHEIDASPEAVELALLSAELPSRIAAAMADVGGPRIESVEPLEQAFTDGRFHRVLRYQAAAPVPALERVLGGRPIARDMLAWIERFEYATATRSGTFEVTPVEPYTRHFRASGVFRLVAGDNGKTQREVEGTLEVHVRVIGRVIERLATAEVKKVYAAEAAALRALSAF